MQLKLHLNMYCNIFYWLEAVALIVAAYVVYNVEKTHVNILHVILVYINVSVNRRTSL